MRSMMSKIKRVFAACLLLSLFAAPVAADTLRYYPNVVQAVPGAGASSLQMSLVDFARFLMDDCDGAAYDCQSGAATVGLGWTGVRFHSDGFYEDLPTPTSLDSLVNATAWEGDGSGLANGDWAVFESADSTGGGGTNHFQLYVEYHNGTTIEFLMLPMEDWVTSSAAPPVWTAGNACGAPACKGVGAGANTLVVFTTLAGACKMTIIGDEDVAVLLRDDGASPDIIYIGGVDNNLAGSTPPDDRPFVIYDTPSDISINPLNAYWNRLAPDDATVLVDGAPTDLYGSEFLDDLPGTYNGVFQIVPAYLMFVDASHKHITGTLQYTRRGSDDLGIAPQTLDTQTWACRGTNALVSPWCWSWDGSAYP